MEFLQLSTSPGTLPDASPGTVRAGSPGSLPDGLWREIVAALPEATIITDAELVAHFASDSIEDLSGFPPHALRGVPLARIIHRDDWDAVARAAGQLTDGIPIITVGARVRFSDGEWHRTSVRATRIERAEEVWIVISVQREQTRMLEELRMGFEGSPVPLALVSIDGTLLRVNDELSNLLDIPRDELVGRPASTLVHRNHFGPATAWGGEILAGGGEHLPELRVELRAAHGRRIWADIAPRPVRNDQGEVASFVLHISDITSMRTVEAELGASEARFATLVDNLPDPVMRLGRQGEPLFSNQAARDTLVADGSGHYVVEEEVRQMLGASRKEALESGTTHTATYEVDTRRGRRTLETRVVPELDAAGDPSTVLLVTSDLTERIRSQRELAHQATHDALTELPNRVAFHAHLRDALAARTAGDLSIVAVLFFDLDRFKVVNDSLGHGMGDALLSVVGQRVRSALDDHDVVARLGGDEFTVLLSDARSAADAIATAERLREVVAEPIDLEGRRLLITCSIGVALATDGDDDPDRLMQWADTAMYRAKERGRNRVSVFDDELAAVARGRLELDQRLRGALERDEFEVHFQPEVDLATGAVLGAEALLRWRSPDGLVSAASFIDLAEETGLIVPIGTWVLEVACGHAARWRAEWPERDLLVRVNLSPRQLDEPGVVELVADVLERTGLPAEALCLEITETALMTNAEASRVLLEQLDALGVWLAVDDFGTGYSSLSYLKQFPVDVLKIDRSFVDGLPDNAEDSAIVRTIIRLADSLGMHVTAEGVEDEAQAAALVRLGCLTGQGFYFDRALPYEEFESRLRGPRPVPGSAP